MCFFFFFTKYLPVPDFTILWRTKVSALLECPIAVREFSADTNSERLSFKCLFRHKPAMSLLPQCGGRAGGQAEASDMLRDTGGCSNPRIVAVACCI